MSRRGCFAAFLFLCVGTVIGTFFTYAVFAAAVAISILIFLLLFKRHIIPVIAMMFLAVGIMLSTISFREYKGQDSDCAVTGRVTAMDKDSFLLSDSVFYGHSELDGTKVYVCARPTGMRFGDTVFVKGSVFPYAANGENPGEYSGILSACADGISCKCYAREFRVTGHKAGLDSLFGALRLRIRDTISQYSNDSECTAVMYAMLTGDKTFIDASTTEAFSTVGVSHLLAVSGLHTSILLGIICLFLTGLRKNSVIRFILVCLFLIFYTVFTGLSPSVIRAAIMAAVFTLTSVFGVRYDMLSSLGMAGILILLINPYRLYDISFLLSFSAIFGIAVFSKTKRNLRIFKLDKSEDGSKRKRLKISANKAYDKLISGALVTLGATVTTLPTTLSIFGTASLISLPVNLLLIPASSVALALLSVAVILSFIFAPLGILIKIPYRIMYIVLYLVKLAANVEAVSFVKPTAWIIPCVLCAIYFFSRYCLVSNKIKRILAVILVFVLCTCVTANAMILRNTVSFNVLALKSGKICVHVRCNEKNYLINPDAESETSVRNYISANVGHLDAVFLANNAFESDADAIYRSAQTDCDGIPLAIGDSVDTGECIFTYVDGGILAECRNIRIFIQTDAEFVQPESCDIAAGTGTALAADTVITYSSHNMACKKNYMMSRCGSIKISIGKQIRFTPYRKE